MFENTTKIVKENKQYLFPLVLQVCFMAKFQELLGAFGLLGLIISIALISISHAEVVGGLKVITQASTNIKEDTYCGFKRYKELFSTYFWLLMMKMLFALAVGYLISLIFFNTKTTAFWNGIFAQVESEMQYGIQDTAKMMAGIGGFVIFLASIFTDYIVKSVFFLVPYLLETKNVRGFAAIKLSINISKGHLKEIFKMQAHYYLYIVFFSCIYFLMNQVTQFILLIPFLSVGLVIVEVHLYRMEYTIAKAELYEKIIKEKEGI